MKPEQAGGRPEDHNSSSTRTPELSAVETVTVCDLCGGVVGEPCRIGRWGLARCEACSVVMTTPRPNTAAIASFYPDGYGPHERQSSTRLWTLLEDLRSAKSGCPNQRSVGWRLVAALFGSFSLLEVPWRQPGERLLEIGAGGGRNLAWAARNGWNVCGVDPSRDAAANVAKQGTPILVGNAENVALVDNYVDTVLMSHVLEHTHHPRAALAEAHRVLRPGGVVVVVVPNFGSLDVRLLRDAWYHLDLPRHLWHFTPAALERVLVSSGFEIEKWRFTTPAITIARAIRQRGRLGLRWRGSRDPVFSATSWRMADCMLAVARNR